MPELKEEPQAWVNKADGSRSWYEQLANRGNLSACHFLVVYTCEYVEMLAYARESNRIIHRNVTYNENDREERTSVISFTRGIILCL